jgi:hypothetical protein
MTEQSRHLLLASDSMPELADADCRRRSPVDFVPVMHAGSEHGNGRNTSPGSVPLIVES